jgi:hypothetical protein
MGSPDRFIVRFRLPDVGGSSIGVNSGVGSVQWGGLGRVSPTWCRLTGCGNRLGNQFDAPIGIEKRIGTGPTIDDADDALA